MNEAARRLVLAVQRRFNDFDGRIKSEESFGERSEFGPPVFIVSAPRTGSTLLFQLMIGWMRLGYISNALALLPSLMVRLSPVVRSRMIPNRGGLKDSHYGYVEGLWSPNEAGKVCSRWFAEGTSAEYRSRVRRTVHALSNGLQAPLLIKAMTVSPSVDVIRHILPDSRFVFIRRDPLFTAQSLLLGRRSFAGGDDRWWSTKPPGHEAVMTKPPLYQVMWQTLTIESILERAFQGRPDQVEVVDYARLCREPAMVLDGISERFAIERLGLGSAELPSKGDLAHAETVRLTKDEWEQLVRFRDELTREIEQAGPGAADPAMPGDQR